MLGWLFRSRQKKDNPDSSKAEHWQTNFGRFDDPRLVHEEGQGYQVEIGDKFSRLQLVKPRLFAWTIDPWFQYRDVVVSGRFSWGVGNAACACGLIFRYTNDLNYYYCMVSRSGNIRFDVVFNGTPVLLIPWVPLPEPLGETFDLMVIAHGRHFSFYIDGRWVCEASDDHLDIGKVGWAGQNFADKTRAEFTLHHFEIESRPVEVEAQYLRWTRVVWTDPAQRRVLANSFFSVGKFVESELQIRRALADSEATKEDRFFLVQCAIRQDRIEEAFKMNQEILAKEPTWPLAVKEKANLLYLRNLFLDLRDYLLPLLERFPDDDLLWNLLGHAETSLGNFEKGISSYEKAVQSNPLEPIYLLNLAKTYERLDKLDLAAQKYIEAGTGFFRKESWTDVEEVLQLLDQIERLKNPQAQALKAKLLFQQGEVQKALPLLKKAAQEDSADGAVYYLLALTIKQNGDTKQAVKELEKALSLEPDYPLFNFRMAEWLQQLGREEYEDYLEKALALAPGDPWILNFKGQVSTSNTDKTFYLEKARLALPEDFVITMNLADHYHALGRRDEAFALLAGWEDKHEVRNLRGNLFSRENRYQEALEEYEQAIKLAPGNVDYKENAAACAMELKMAVRAEDLLLDVIEIDPSAKAYTALGNLLRVEGDFIRSEVTLRSAIEIDNTYLPAQVELGHLYLARQKFSLAKELLERLKDQKDDSSVKELEDAYKKLAGEVLSCSSCGRQWWVPRTLPYQESLKVRGEIPDEAPAGTSVGTGKIYCVGCAKEHMKEGRFLCPETEEPLVFRDDRLKYLLRQILESQDK